MRTDKERSIKLRKKGYSYNEIARILGKISKSTLSLWLADIILDTAARNRLSSRIRAKSLGGLLKRNKNQTQLAIHRRDTTRALAKQQVKNISKDNLFFIGLALYWAEGYKRAIIKNGREVTNHPISLTNSDPYLVKTFINFLHHACGVSVDRIRASLRIFPQTNKRLALNYWSDSTGIPQENFRKTSVVISSSSNNKKPFNRLPYGIIQIRISDTNLFHKIMGWIEGLKEQINMPR